MFTEVPPASPPAPSATTWLEEATTHRRTVPMVAVSIFTGRPLPSKGAPSAATRSLAAMAGPGHTSATPREGPSTTMATSLSPGARSTRTKPLVSGGTSGGNTRKPSWIMASARAPLPPRRPAAISPAPSSAPIRPSAATTPLAPPQTLRRSEVPKGVLFTMSSEARAPSPAAFSTTTRLSAAKATPAAAL